MFKRKNFKIRLTIVLLLIVPLFCDSIAHAQPWLGSGTEGDPYQIWDANDMQAIGADANYWDAHFELMNDIDLGAYTGASYNIIGNDVNAFTGVFDGNGHTISNFTYDSNGIDYIGVLGYIYGPNVEVKNLGLLNPDVNAGDGVCVGALVGLSYYNGSISSCYVEGGSVTGGRYYVGGLVGYSHYNGTISGCYVEGGSVAGEGYVGGLVGCDYRGDISGCYSTGVVSGEIYVGGLIGRNSSSSKVTNSYSRCSVEGESYVGGLTGYNSANIYYCYSTGIVLGTADVGGLVGYSNRATVGSYWDTETSGIDYSATGAGLTTAQLQSVSTFAESGWGGCGNEGEWTIDEGNDYPRLGWEGKAGMVISGELSDLLGGIGTPGEPYLIYNASQLNMVGVFPCEWSGCFKLMADIDMGSYTGTSYNIIGTGIPFTGIFDGNGHTISNFTYDSSGMNSIGLFGYIYDPNAEVKNLGLINSNVDAGTGWYVGSLVGVLRDGTITGCYAESGSVSGYWRVGGLVGWNYNGSIQESYSTGSVTGEEGVGGLAGEMDGYGSISNCFSQSTVTGEYAVGGLIGRNKYSTVSNSYSTGSVTGGWLVGGLVGEGGYDYIKCFWDRDVNPDVNGIGNMDEPNVVGLPTAEMQMESTFTDAGWDFVGEVINGANDIWQMCALPDYPKLWWEECFEPAILANVEIKPETLNLGSKGRWVSCYIWLPEDYNVADIEPNSILLGDEVEAERVWLGDEFAVAKFSRRAVQEMLGEAETPGELELVVSGELGDGTIFEGTDTIRVIDVGGGKNSDPPGKALKQLNRKRKRIKGP